MAYDDWGFSVSQAVTHKPFLRDLCDYALKKGLPVFVSESAGMEASGNGTIDYTE